MLTWGHGKPKTWAYFNDQLLGGNGAGIGNTCDVILQTLRTLALAKQLPTDRNTRIFSLQTDNCADKQKNNKKPWSKRPGLMAYQIKISVGVSNYRGSVPKQGRRRKGFLDLVACLFRDMFAHSPTLPRRRKESDPRRGREP